MEHDPENHAQKLTLVLVDDHAVVRAALKVLLESEPDLEVVAEAGTADDAIRYVGAHRPDVLILDLNMPGRPSLEAIPDIRHASPDTRIVILTMRNEPAFARQALRAGVMGYVLKEAADAELVLAVRRAAEGETYLQPSLYQHLADQGSDLYDKERDAGHLEELRDQLAAVERAEQRLADGTYGLSIESGTPIPDARLAVVPTAERTVEEQAAWERQGGG